MLTYLRAFLGERSGVEPILYNLITQYRTQTRSAISASYQPTPPDALRQLTIYSANLILMIESLVPFNRKMIDWEAVVRLWQTLSTREFEDIFLIFERNRDQYTSFEEAGALLRGHRHTYDALLLGHAMATTPNGYCEWTNHALGSICGIGIGFKAAAQFNRPGAAVPRDEIVVVIDALSWLLAKPQLNDAAIVDDYHHYLTTLVDERDATTWASQVAMAERAEWEAERRFRASGRRSRRDRPGGR